MVGPQHPIHLGPLGVLRGIIRDCLMALSASEYQYPCCVIVCVLTRFPDDPSSEGQGSSMLYIHHFRVSQPHQQIQSSAALIH